jgi:hypothetical protein
VDTYRSYLSDPIGSIGECGSIRPSTAPVELVA